MPAAPLVTLLGATLVMVGGGLITKFCVPVVTPLAESLTLTGIVPVAVNSVLGTVAVMIPEATTEILVSNPGVPFHKTVDVFGKFVPVKVMATLAD